MRTYKFWNEAGEEKEHDERQGVYGACQPSLLLFTKFRNILEFVMGLETLSSVEIKERFHKEDKSLPNMFWQHGTLWIDTDDTDDLRVIKEAMEEDVLTQNLTVDFTLQPVTETEPWDQWSMDIKEK